MPTYRRMFEGQMEQLDAIRDFVQQAATALGADERDAFACQLVADEAATNAFEHAYAGQPGRVEVTIRREADAVLLSVHNWGAPFDPETVPEPDLRRSLEDRPIGGLGLFLMRKLMDEVSFAFDPRAGNTVTMRRRLDRPGGRAGAQEPASPIEPIDNS